LGAAGVTQRGGGVMQDGLAVIVAAGAVVLALLAPSLGAQPVVAQSAVAQSAVAQSAVAQPATRPAAALDVAGLAALLGQRRETQARFVEERFVAGLDQPLRSSGTLSFVPPARFVRQTLLPRPELLALDGNQVTMQRGGRTRTMALDSVPEATALLEAMRGALTGDLASLQKHYVARVDGTATRWRLSLSPRAERLGTQVQRLEIEGQGAELRSVELQLAGGDRSTMAIEPLLTSGGPAAPK
jgi:Outer membrane lipoprotein carrier protein LolA-like